MEERSAVDKNLNYSIPAILLHFDNIIEKMIRLCKTATRTGKTRRAENGERLIAGFAMNIER